MTTTTDTATVFCETCRMTGPATLPGWTEAGPEQGRHHICGNCRRIDLTCRVIQLWSNSMPHGDETAALRRIDDILREGADLAALDAEITEEDGGARARLWQPTHRLIWTSNGMVRTIYVALVSGGLDLGVHTGTGGPAYTEENWMNDEEASWERDDEGTWTFRGHSLPPTDELVVQSLTSKDDARPRATVMVAQPFPALLTDKEIRSAQGFPAAPAAPAAASPQTEESKPTLDTEMRAYAHSWHVSMNAHYPGEQSYCDALSVVEDNLDVAIELAAERGVTITERDAEDWLAAERNLNEDRADEPRWIPSSTRNDASAWLSALADEFTDKDGRATARAKRAHSRDLAETIGSCLHSLAEDYKSAEDPADFGRLAASTLTGLFACLSADIKLPYDGTPVIQFADALGVK